MFSSQPDLYAAHMQMYKCANVQMYERANVLKKVKIYKYTKVQQQLSPYMFSS